MQPVTPPLVTAVELHPLKEVIFRLDKESGKYYTMTNDESKLHSRLNDLGIRYGERPDQSRYDDEIPREPGEYYRCYIIDNSGFEKSVRAGAIFVPSDDLLKGLRFAPAYDTAPADTSTVSIYPNTPSPADPELANKFAQMNIRLNGNDAVSGPIAAAIAMAGGSFNHSAAVINKHFPEIQR